MMRFTTDQLQTFVTVFEYGTFDAAADILGVSASAISQRIKAMEQLAGRVLLKRTNPVEPTEPGQAVLRIARQSEFLHAEMERELDGGEEGQSVAVAVNADSLATWFLDAVAQLAGEDRIFCDVRREAEYHSSALLRSGEVMAALTSSPESIPGCSVERLGHVRYLVVASRPYLDRYFPDYPQVTAGNLAAAPVVEFDRKDFGLASARGLLIEQFDVDGATWGGSPTIYLPSSPDYARAVLGGIAWGILPEAQAAEALAAGELVQLTPEPVDVPLYWQRWNISSPVLARLSERVYAAAGKGVLR
ncbi:MULTISPECIES: ArgP/LysG family DNA-binding transcriptional regulator [Rothia]|uniref:Transcriptional regulator ArgP n=1 Tax=Rothia nasimurium TaxID=85336 RepID=A0A1Y1RNZ0_9MICC|nr:MULTISPECIES: ArgP/LysG family DNA-binding transcriptional regulator [Rothia]ORC15915.1 transcriptional regulator ArgP [Rothia nasimurium]